MQTTRFVSFMALLITGLSFSGCWGDRVEPQFPLTGITFNDDTVPVVILGGGIAGLTAAYYCAQANIPCLVLEGPKPGGALTQSHSVRNWPGVIDAPGKDIVESIHKQAVHRGARIVSERAMSVDLKQWPRVIEAQDVQDKTKTRTIRALAVIIAMGRELIYLGVPGEWGEQGYWGRGVGNCAVCDGSLYKDKDVAVVGGGDSAITEAEYLADIARKVTILVRSGEFKAKNIVARDTVLALPNVQVMFNTEVTQMLGDGKTLTHVNLHNNKTKQDSTLNLDGLFLAIGSKPNTSMLRNQLELDDRKCIVLKNRQETSVKGVFAAGDIADQEFMQSITAAGDGAKAALQAIKFLQIIGYHTLHQQGAAKPETKPVATSTTQAPATSEQHVVYQIKTIQEFTEHVIASKKPVVVDLFATWCIPCQRMMPIVEAAAEGMKDRISFVKINVDTAKLDVDELLAKLGSDPIRGVPTFLIVKGGKEVGRLVGGRSEQQFKQEIEEKLGSL